MNTDREKQNKDRYLQNLTLSDLAKHIYNSSSCAPTSAPFHCEEWQVRCPLKDSGCKDHYSLACISKLICWLSRQLKWEETKINDNKPCSFTTTQQDIDDFEAGKYYDQVENYFGYSLAIFADKVHENAVNHGWYEKEPSFLEIAALIHSEVSEAVQAYRNGEDEHIGEEFADIILRVLDYCSAKNINIEKELVKKYEFNLTRPYKHGGKRI